MKKSYCNIKREGKINNNNNHHHHINNNNKWEKGEIKREQGYAKWEAEIQK